MKYWISFIGPVRSGHTLIAAILDAHPHMIIANEAKGILNNKDCYNLYIKLQEDKYHFSEMNQEFADNNFFIPSQWQGKTKIKDTIGIGNKRSGPETEYWSCDFPNNIKMFEKTISLPIKFIHVYRDREFNVESMMRMNKKNREYNEKIYDAETEVADNIAKNYSSYKVWFNSFLNHTGIELKRLCDYLEIFPYEDWIKSCKKIVRKK